MLTGLAGQISLGPAGFLCAGAFTVGILTESVKAPPLVALPAAAMVGALLGILVGVPSLRLRGLYLALGTLAMHFVVLYVASEYQARWGFNTGVSVPAPVIAGIRVRTGVQWYYVLVAFAMLTTFLSVNLGRSRVGRAWMAIHDREIDRKSTRLNSSHGYISYAVFCLKKKKTSLWLIRIRRLRRSVLGPCGAP